MRMRGGILIENFNENLKILIIQNWSYFGLFRSIFVQSLTLHVVIELISIIYHY